MEIQDVFSIDIVKRETGLLQVKAVPDKSHWIYSAHFPGRPITPGAVILHTLQQIVSNVLAKAYKVEQIKSMRFFTPLEPGNVGSVVFSIELLEEDSRVRVKCTVTDGETRFSRIGAVLAPYI